MPTLNRKVKEQVGVHMANTDSIKSNTVAWNEIDWRKVEIAVHKLQKRISKPAKVTM